MSGFAEAQYVTSLEPEELAPYRTLRRPVAHAEQGIFVAEGEKVVRRLLDTDLEVVSLLLTPDWWIRLRSSGHLAARPGLRIYLAENDLLRQIVGFNIHQGIMAVARVPAEGSLSELPEPHLLVGLDRLRTSENVGVIVRNCAAFGVTAILAAEKSCSPYLRRAVRNSMGAVFQMPVMQVAGLADALTELRRRCRTRVVVADPHGAQAIGSVDLRGNVCLVLGNEDEGVSPEVAKLADCRVAIPMKKKTDSLNVGCAGAVFLYEAVRQRDSFGKKP